MPRSYKDFTEQELDKLIPLLRDVSKATALRPKEQQHLYREAQESVVTAKRVAEKRVGQLRIS